MTVTEFICTKNVSKSCIKKSTNKKDFPKKKTCKRCYYRERTICIQKPKVEKNCTCKLSKKCALITHPDATEEQKKKLYARNDCCKKCNYVLYKEKFRKNSSIYYYNVVKPKREKRQYL
jgi:hypothetical protein